MSVKIFNFKQNLQLRRREIVEWMFEIKLASSINKLNTEIRPLSHFQYLFDFFTNTHILCESHECISGKMKKKFFFKNLIYSQIMCEYDYANGKIKF